MAKDFKATIQDPRRRNLWIEALNRDWVCIQSPIPTLTNLPGHPAASVYLVDLDLLTPEEKNSITQSLARKFNMNPQAVNRLIEKNGIPILTDNCTITIENAQAWSI